MHSILTLDALHAAVAAAGGHCAAAFANFAEAAAPIAVSALWQGMLVVVALVLCLRFAPRVSAVHRFGIWAAAFAAVAALPFLPILAHFSAAAVQQTSGSGAAAATPWLLLDSRWGFIVAALWLAASFVRAADLGFHSLRLRRLWKAATPARIDANLRSSLAARTLTDRNSARRPVEICTTRDLDRPSVIGFFAPRILIPEWLFARLTPGELEQVVLHEAEHLRRRDDWTNLLQKLSLVLFPLNPALAWMERRLCREREMACDEGVVRRTQAPRAYAACLTSLAERSLNRRSEALSLGAWQHRPELVRRVHSILWRKQALHPAAARVWVGAVGCGLLFASVELARCPQVVAFVPESTTGPVANIAKANEAVSPAAVERARVERTLIAPAERTDVAAVAAGSRTATNIRAIETKAILPASGRAKSPLETASGRLAPQLSNGYEEREMASYATGVPHQVLLKAEMPNDAAPSAPEQSVASSGNDDPKKAIAASPADGETSSSPGWRYIVLTAWEQVQTKPQRASLVRDYSTAAGADREDANGGSTPDSKPVRQVTVTRVILAVYDSGSAPRAKNSQATNPDLSPAAVPFDGGWLVFQL